MNYINGIATFIVVFFVAVAGQWIFVKLIHELFALYRWKGIGFLFLACIFFASYYIVSTN